MSVKGKRIIFVVLFCSLILCLSGCSLHHKKEPPVPVKKVNSIGLKDASGRSFRLKSPPQRIVSLSLRSDEILLGMVEPSRICALSKWADDPLISNVVKEAGQVPVRSQITEEFILSMHPDFVITTQSQPYDLIFHLRSLNIPVYVCPLARTVKDTQKMILDLGQVLMAEQKATQMVQDMEDVVRDIQKKVASIPENERLTVYRFSVSGGNGGKNTYYNDVCRLAGVKNAAAEMKFWGTQLMPLEQIVHTNPDVFLLPTWDYTGKIDLEAYKKEIRQDPVLQNVKAVKNNRLYVIPDKHMLSSSQFMVECIRDIYEACYGFKKGKN